MGHMWCSYFPLKYVKISIWESVGPVEDTMARIYTCSAKAEVHTQI